MTKNVDHLTRWSQRQRGPCCIAQLHSQKLNRNVIWLPCHYMRDTVFPLLEKPIKQYKASIAIVHFLEETKNIKMDEITQKQIFENKCSWERHAPDCALKPIRLSLLGNAGPDPGLVLLRGMLHEQAQKKRGKCLASRFVAHPYHWLY